MLHFPLNNFTLIPHELRDSFANMFFKALNVYFCVSGAFLTKHISVQTLTLYLLFDQDSDKYRNEKMLKSFATCRHQREP